MDDMISSQKGSGKGKRRKGAKGKGRGKDTTLGAAEKPDKPKKENKAPGKKKAVAKPTVGTAKALDMSLEDIVKAETKGRKGAWKKDGQDDVAKAPGSKKLWAGATKLGKRRKEGAGGKGAGKDKWSSDRGKGKGGKGWGKGGGGKGKDWGKSTNRWSPKADWEDSWDGRKKNNQREWQKGSGKKWKGGDSWGAPAKKDWGGKQDSWGGQEKRGGWGGGGGNDRWEAAPTWKKRNDDYRPSPPKESWTRKDSGSGGQRQNHRDSDHWEPERRSKGHSERDTSRGRAVARTGERGGGGDGGRGGREVVSAVTEVWGRGRKRAFEEEERADRERVPPKKIKVKNIPKDLEIEDIKDAFEAEAGRIAMCDMERGKQANQAWITFTNAKDAKKAVETFDRGELNGKTIEVTFDRS